MNRQPLIVAVVGATGVVGRTMIQILNEREFPVGELTKPEVRERARELQQPRTAQLEAVGDGHGPGPERVLGDGLDPRVLGALHHAREQGI